MKISIIFGLLIIKVSTDLICECRRVDRPNFNALEAYTHPDVTEPIDGVYDDGTEVEELNNDLNGDDEGTPATEDLDGENPDNETLPENNPESDLLDNEETKEDENDKKKEEENPKLDDSVPKENDNDPNVKNKSKKKGFFSKFKKMAKKPVKKVKKAVKKGVKKVKKGVQKLVKKFNGFKEKVKGLKEKVHGFKEKVKGLKEKVAGFKERPRGLNSSLLEVGNTAGYELNGPRGVSSKSNLMDILMNSPVKVAKPKVLNPTVREEKTTKGTDLDNQLSGLKAPSVKSKSTDNAQKGVKKTKKQDLVDTLSSDLSLEDALGNIDFGSDDENNTESDLLDNNDKDNTNNKEETEYNDNRKEKRKNKENKEDTSGKELKGLSKVEDINPANKTNFKEKIVDEDTTLDREFKKELGDGEFSGKINYYKKREKTKEGGSQSKVKTIYVPRDPSEDWNNSGLAASLRYLGSGYDIVFGNPLGDPVVMMDQGYRNPVIKLNWDVEYLNKDGANLKEPHGSWVRPEFSCRQAETIDHINTVEDFKKELAVDAQASYGIPYFFSFSASTGYKNFVQSTATNKVRTYITKTYCLRYVAGIVNYNALETTDEFKKAVSSLPDYFDSEACTIELFKSNEDDPMCVKTVKPWVQFIKMFGTHFTTIVHLGGKITHQVQINKSDVLTMQEKGVNVDVAVKAVISPGLLDNLQGGTKTNSDNYQRSQSENFKYNKQVLVIGGDSLVDSKDMDSLNHWTKDLYKKPMPIKVKLESIKSLLTNQRHRNSFEEALKFYSETYGVSPDEIYKKYGKEFGIASQVLKGHQVVYSGSRSGSAVCPNKTVIIMGFTLTILKKKNFVGKNEFAVHISHCPVGEEKCIVSNDQGSETRIWAVCGEDTIPLLNQQTSVSIGEPANATCPPGYSIAFGFGLSIPTGNVVLSTDSYPCRSATASCVHKSADDKATNAVWIACVENGAPELNDISNKMVSTSSRQCSSKSQLNEYDDIVCPINSKLVAGWSIDFTETNNLTLNQMNKCSKETQGCKVDKMMAVEKQCRSHYSWIACLNNQENSIK